MLYHHWQNKYIDVESTEFGRYLIELLIFQVWVFCISYRQLSRLTFAIFALYNHWQNKYIDVESTKFGRYLIELLIFQMWVFCISYRQLSRLTNSELRKITISLFLRYTTIGKTNILTLKVPNLVDI